MENELKLMRERHSVRSYLDKKIEGEVKEKLESIMKEIEMESGLTISLILNEEKAFDTHYGTFKNAFNYLVISGKDEDGAEEKCGYYGEKLVLRAQWLGLRTCWTVLTYNPECIKVPDGEVILSLICIGYGENDGFVHRMKERSDITHNIDGVPDWFLNGLDAVLLAPSAKNQQKIGFDYVGDSIVKPYIIEERPWINIDMGIAKYHFEVGAYPTKIEWK